MSGKGGKGGGGGGGGGSGGGGRGGGSGGGRGGHGDGGRGGRGGGGRGGHGRDDHGDRDRDHDGDYWRRRHYGYNNYNRGYDTYNYYYYDTPDYFVIPVADVRQRFTVPLTFAQEVFPPGMRPPDSLITGTFTITFNRDLTRAAWSLTLSPPRGVPGTQIQKAHIHAGPAGVNGPIIETLFDSDVPVNGLQKEGFITMDVANLWRLIQQGQVYANAHGSGIYRDPGLARGQIVA